MIERGVLATMFSCSVVACGATTNEPEGENSSSTGQLLGIGRSAGEMSGEQKS